MKTSTESDNGSERSVSRMASAKKKLEALFAEYGSIAVAIYLVIFLLTLAGFGGAFLLGVDFPEGGMRGAGTLAVLWAAMKLTQPFRIAATVVLTPPVAKVWRKHTG